MANKEIEAKVKQAFTNITPDVFDSVLADCKERKGSVIVMTEKKNRNRWIKSAAGIAAAFVLLIGGIFGFGAYQMNHKVASTISLDVNPSIEIQVNQKERVLEVIPLNEDGKTVIGDMDLKGSDLEVTVNALIGSMLKNGYLSDIANSILVSVDNADPVKGADLQKKLTEEINKLLQTSTFSGAVLSQTIKQDNATEKLADQYGMTLGKAQLIQQIVSQNTRYTFEDLVSLSINELNLISESGNTHLDHIESVGTASDKSYIGEAKAKEAALKHAGVKAEDIYHYSCEMDYEHGKMVYEIEFDSNGYEYDYDIDASTGDVVKYHKEAEDDFHPNTGNTEGPGGSTGEPSIINEETAKAVAFEHAGISSGDAKNVKCELDWENGKRIYEIEFRCNGYEYDYEIDASTGTVAKYQKESDDDDENSAGGNNEETEPVSSGVIDAATAKAAAFKHAGISAAAAEDVKCELDWEDGKRVYEIEFHCQGYEYDYEIDASSGKLIKYEIDDETSD